MIEIDNKPTLSKILKDNHELLSAMAILVAIATFAAGLSVHWLASTLTFLSIAGVVTIWFELNSAIPKSGTVRLFIFRQILLVGLYCFILYWLLAFRKFWNIFLFIPIASLLAYMFLLNLRQLEQVEFIRKIFGVSGVKNWWQKLFTFLFGFFVFIAIFYILTISIPVSLGLNYILDLVRLNFY